MPAVFPFQWQNLPEFVSLNYYRQYLQQHQAALSQVAVIPDKAFWRSPLDIFYGQVRQSKAYLTKSS